MTHFEIILTGLALAFCWVNLIAKRYQVIVWGINLFNRKPFNCMMCMSGWFSAILANLNGYSYQSILFLAVGVFVGAVWEGITMRWL